MSHFLRLLSEEDKSVALLTACQALRQGGVDYRNFETAPESFDAVPGKPFAYWVSDEIREIFKRLPRFEGDGRTVRVGLQTSDDFRFLRDWWEVDCDEIAPKWRPFAKGGAFSPFYADVHLSINWMDDGAELIAFPLCVIRNPDYYFRSGITWPLRAHRFSPQLMPAGCIFSVRGYSAFPAEGCELATLALFSSAAFDYIFKTALGRFGYPEFIVGVLQMLPWVEPTTANAETLQRLAKRAWSLKRSLDTVNETSHAFLLPLLIRDRIGAFATGSIESELADIQAEIDSISFNLYGFSEADRQATMGQGAGEVGTDDDIDDDVSEDAEAEAPPVDALLSWAVGVAFGRFDWRLATGERAAPAEPEPFDPLPARSPGMLPDGAEPFHAHAGILLDDQGHPHDLARLIEEVLVRVEVPVPEDVRRWLQRDFFAFHLQRYSKSRRKAPIYWPLATTSGSYTLWVYYPSLTSQTLYTAINDFVEPKLKHVGADVTTLRNKGSARTRDDEKQFEALQAFELELTELRDTLLKLAPTYKPNHDDGVQITAAPLWPLFRHKPWQKVLKDTWEKLKKGDYDWAHLAMNYWPERVREKCKTDKSLAIAHGLEALYIEPEAKPKKARGKKN
ncbi:MAG: type II restriction endonuclease subunit M [Steroidobacteraceae bacterium]